jgi:hypothetical protein
MIQIGAIQDYPWGLRGLQYLSIPPSAQIAGTSLLNLPRCAVIPQYSTYTTHVVLRHRWRHHAYVQDACHGTSLIDKKEGMRQKYWCQPRHQSSVLIRMSGIISRVRLAGNLLNVETFNKKSMITTTQQGLNTHMEAFHNRITICDE